MGFFEAYIWKHSALQNIRQLLSSPKNMQAVIHVGENGVVSLMKLPGHTSTFAIPDSFMTWVNIQKLKDRCQGIKESVLTISDRSYIPCDVRKRMTEQDRKSLTPLDDLATTRYNKAFTRVAMENQKSANAKLITTIVYLGFVMVCVVLLIVFIKK